MSEATMAPSDLAVRVARAIKTSLDAEGVDFSTTAQDEPLHFQRMQRADERFRRENPDLLQEIRDWYLANHPPLREEATNDPFLAEHFYLGRFLTEHGSWWEILREAAGTPIEAPAAPELADEPRSWEPQPWWDALDERVRLALLTVQEREDVRPSQPDLYDRSGRMLKRFARDYPELAAALANRYAALNDGEVSAEDADVIGIGLWITENIVGEPFVPRDGSG
jgi:hypothetical protein